MDGEFYLSTLWSLGETRREAQSNFQPNFFPRSNNSFVPVTRNFHFYFILFFVHEFYSWEKRG